MKLGARFQLHGGPVSLVPPRAVQGLAVLPFLYHRLFQVHVVFSLSQPSNQVFL